MQSFKHYSPTKIIFGREAHLHVAEELQSYCASRVFLVYGGGSVVKSGLLGQIEKDLQSAGIQCRPFGGAKPNPLLSHARKGVLEAIAFKSDFILAVGGGSAIDTAKGIAHGAASPGVDIWEYWQKTRKVEKSLPIGVVLTISAAGSETSDSAVLTHETLGVKRGLSTDFNRPVLAFMNPELTFTLSSYQVSCGIADIMMHTLDRYFTPTTGNELTDEFAEALLRTTIKNGAIAARDHTHYGAMSELMWCGSLSHNGITGLGAVTDFSVHKLGHELSARFDVAHGASLSAVWGAWANACCAENPARFARLGEKVWGLSKEPVAEMARNAIRATVDYFKEIKMPVCFSDLDIGVQPDQVVKEMAQACIQNMGGPIGNFKKLDFADVYRIYQAANQ